MRFDVEKFLQSSIDPIDTKAPLVPDCSTSHEETASTDSYQRRNIIPHFAERLLGLVRRPDKLIRTDNDIKSVHATWGIVLPSGRTLECAIDLHGCRNGAALQVFTCPYLIGANDAERLFQNPDWRELHGMERPPVHDWTKFT